MSNIVTLPQEVAQIAENVSVEKRNEVQEVLNSVFNGVSKMREQLDSVSVADENDKVNMKLANTIRLGVRQVRLSAEKTFDAKREEVQQQMLSYKTEDSLWLKAKQTMQILTKEIEENARWKEETKERFDKEQKELNTQQRMLKVAKFAPEMLRSEFENMSDETFVMFYNGLEKSYNDAIEAQRLEAERIENERLEEIERQKQLAIEAEKARVENERLQAQLKKEREEAESKQKAIEEQAKAEKAKQDAIIADQKRLAEIEAKKQADIIAQQQAEIKAKADAELKAKQEREANELKAKQEAEKLSKAPIKKQLKVWIETFTYGTPPENETFSNTILLKFQGFKDWALQQIETI